MLVLWKAALRSGLFIFIFPTFAFAKVTIQFSEPLGVLKFMESQYGSMGGSREYKTLYRRSKFRNKKTDRLIANYKRLSERFKTQAKPGDLQSNHDKNLVFAAQSKTAAEFLKKARAHYKNTEDYRNLRNLFNHFQPIYNELVTKPHRQGAEDYIGKLNGRLEKAWKFDEWQKCAGKFLGTRPDAMGDTYLAYYPVPGLRGTNGQSTIGVEMMGSDPKQNDLDGDLGVVLHEKVHTMYAYIPQKRKDMIREWIFQELKPKDDDEWFDMEGVFEEALATVIGNVWAFEKAAKRSPSDPWYDEPRINHAAKKIYNAMEKKLNKCEPMDELFFKSIAPGLAEAMKKGQPVSRPKKEQVSQ